MSTKKGARRKALRYFRWAVKIAFLLAFLLPIKYFADAAVDLPVYSLAYGGLTKPLFTVPYGQSVCSVFLVNWAPDGGWIACPVGGVEVLLTAGREPQPDLDVPWLLLLTLVAILLFLILVILLGAMFCS